MWAIHSLLLVLIWSATTLGEECQMCPDNGNITCADTILRGDGQTCGGMAVEMADLEGDECRDYQYWGDACCVQGDCPPDLPALPDTPPVSPPNPPGQAVGVGSGQHQPCNLCRDGSYPGNPWMLINLLGYGEGTCDRWYYFALEGNVVAHQCDALMCKCSTYNICISTVLYGNAYIFAVLYPSSLTLEIGCLVTVGSVSLR